MQNPGEGFIVLIIMKRTIAFLAILFLGSVSVFAETSAPRATAKPADRFENPLLEDVVQMTRAQLPESSILAFVRSRRSRLETGVTANDVIRLHRAGVSDSVVAYIARATGIKDGASSWRDRGRERSGESRADSDHGRDGDREHAEADRDRDRDTDREIDHRSDRDRDHVTDRERDREGSDADREGVVAYDGPGDRDGYDDGEIHVYGRPYGAVYDSWPGWWDYPYWWGISPYWGTGFFYRGGGGFRGGHGWGGGWHRGDGGGWHRGDRGGHRGGSSNDGAGRSGGSSGGSHPGGPQGGGSHGGGSHGGGSHGGGSHGGGGGHSSGGHGGGVRH